MDGNTRKLPISAAREILRVIIWHAERRGGYLDDNTHTHTHTHTNIHMHAEDSIFMYDCLHTNYRRNTCIRLCVEWAIVRVACAHLVPYWYVCDKREGFPE